MEKIDLPIWNFLLNNLLRFVILQKNWYTAFLLLWGNLSRNSEFDLLNLVFGTINWIPNH